MRPGKCPINDGGGVGRSEASTGTPMASTDWEGRDVAEDIDGSEACAGAAVGPVAGAALEAGGAADGYTGASIVAIAGVAGALSACVPAGRAKVAVVGALLAGAAVCWPKAGYAAVSPKPAGIIDCGACMLLEVSVAN